MKYKTVGGHLIHIGAYFILDNELYCYTIESTMVAVVPSSAYAVRGAVSGAVAVPEQ